MPSTGEPTIPGWLTIFEVEGLREPTGISVLDERLFVADHTQNALLGLRWTGSPSTTGEASRTPHEGGAEPRRVCLSPMTRFVPRARQSRLRLPHGVLAMESGIFVADTLNDRVLKLDHALSVQEMFTHFDGKAMCRPHAVDSNVPDEWFIVDTDNGRVIRMVGGRGAELAITGLERALCKPCGLCLTPNRILIADTFNHRLVVTDREGTVTRTYGREGSGVGMFRYPVAVAAWQHWFVVSDEYNKRLQLWRSDEEGGCWTATCLSSSLCAPWLGKPFGVVFNPDGHLFIADRAHGRILMVDFEAMLAASFDDVD